MVNREVATCFMLLPRSLMLSILEFTGASVNLYRMRRRLMQLVTSACDEFMLARNAAATAAIVATMNPAADWAIASRELLLRIFPTVMTTLAPSNAANAAHKYRRS